MIIWRSHREIVQNLEEGQNLAAGHRVDARTRGKNESKKVQIFFSQPRDRTKP
jgi:hypothetical protein